MFSRRLSSRLIPSMNHGSQERNIDMKALLPSDSMAGASSSYERINNVGMCIRRVKEDPSETMIAEIRKPPNGL